MKVFLFIVLISLSAFNLGCVTSAQKKEQNQTKFSRKPFQKSKHVINQVDPKDSLTHEDGKTVDIKARVIVVDKKAGKYEFRWIGYDGKEKIVAYQRHDAIDGNIEASVEKLKGNKFQYNYLVTLFPSSPSRLINFIVRTNTTVVKPVEEKDISAYYRRPLYQTNNTYRWLSYYPRHENGLIVDAGEKIRFLSESTDPPGITKYWVSGGSLGTKGVGEDVPLILEREIPIFHDLAHGFTIAPDERLSKYSNAEKIQYLLESLPKFHEAGWMSEGTMKIYKQTLEKGGSAGVLKRAKKDFKKEFISIEVLEIIKGLRL